MTIDWSDWLGLPHRIGADPREGKAACCLVIARIVLQDAGLATPPIDQMIEQAQAGDWIPLQRQFYSFCEATTAPELHSITLLRNGAAGLGVGTIVAPNTLLTLHHRRGVIALPVNRLRLLKFYRVKQ
jgi:hypothetical protein